MHKMLNVLVEIDWKKDTILCIKVKSKEELKHTFPPEHSIISKTGKTNNKSNPYSDQMSLWWSVLDVGIFKKTIFKDSSFK